MTTETNGMDLEHSELPSDSILEIWRFVFQSYPRVESMTVPGLPVYKRALVAELVTSDSEVDWDLTLREDWEYVRIAEWASRKCSDVDAITVDLSAYDIEDGRHWTEIIQTLVNRSPGYVRIFGLPIATAFFSTHAGCPLPQLGTDEQLLSKSRVLLFH